MERIHFLFFLSHMLFELCLVLNKMIRCVDYIDEMNFIYWNTFVDYT